MENYAQMILMLHIFHKECTIYIQSPLLYQYVCIAIL